LDGYWSDDLPPFATRYLPRFAIGVHHEGDWHEGVADAFESGPFRLDGGTSSNVPSWLRNQGAIYTYAGGDLGGIYDFLPTGSILHRLDSFRQLPRLLQEARTLGTNVIYLSDYWDGKGDPFVPHEWVKGDYIPRADLGGADALREGIAAVHRAGGRVILYV